MHELLRGYEDGDLLGGWVLFHEWIDEGDGHVIGINFSPGLDWPRAAGIAEVGRLKMRRLYLGDEEEEE